jgi:hypothetical protein
MCLYVLKIDFIEVMMECIKIFENSNMQMMSMMMNHENVVNNNKYQQGSHSYQPMVNTSTTNHVSCRTSNNNWNSLEVVLFIVHLCIDKLKEILMKSNSNSNSNSSNSNSNYQQSIAQLLYHSIQLILSLPYDYCFNNHLFYLQSTICKYFGCLTFLLTKSNKTFNFSGSFSFVTIYYSVLRYLFVVFSNPSRYIQISIQSSKSIHKLIVNGMKLLTSLVIHNDTVIDVNMDNAYQYMNTEGYLTLKYMIETLGSYISSSSSSSSQSSSSSSTSSIIIDSSSMMTLIESIARCIMSLSITHLRDELILKVGSKIVESIVVEMHSVTHGSGSSNSSSSRSDGNVSNDALNKQRIEKLLLYASQLIRFSDVAMDTTSSPNVAVSVAASIIDHDNIAKSSDHSRHSHPLIPFLHHFWPILHHIFIDHRINNDNSIISAVFDVFSRILMSLGSYGLDISIIITISECVISTIAKRATTSSSALQCSSSLIQCLVNNYKNHHHNSDDFLHSFIVSIIDTYCLHPSFQPLLNNNNNNNDNSYQSNCISYMQIFGNCSEALDQCFEVLHTYIIFKRDRFSISSLHTSSTSSSSSSSSKLIYKTISLCCLCLKYSTERDPLRSAMQLLQLLFMNPSTTTSSSSSITGNHNYHHDGNNSNNLSVEVQQQQQLSSEFNTHRELMKHIVLYGQMIVQLLIDMITRSTIMSSLVTNITETLYYLLIACEEDTASASSSSSSNSGSSTTLSLLNQHESSSFIQCQQWFHAVIYSTDHLTQLTLIEHRHILYNAIFYYAKNRNRKFKSLFQDLYKICASEANIDALLTYTE